MSEKAVKYLVYSQLCFFAFMTMCIFISPELNDDGGALSNYGNYRATILPYALSLVLCSFFLWLASNNIAANKENRVLKFTMRMVAILNAIILVTPIQAGIVSYAVHITATFLLFGLEFGFGLWLTFQFNRNRVVLALFMLQLFGLILVLLSLREVEILKLLLVGQMLAVGSFALLLTYATAKFLGVSTSENLKMTQESQSPEISNAA